MSFNLSQEELKGILAEVDADLEKLLAKNEESSSSSSSSVAKDEGSPDEASPEMSASADGSASGEGSAPEGMPGAEGSEGAEGMPAGDGAALEGGPSAGAPMDPAASAGAPGAAPAEEPLEAKLEALPLDQLRHLYMSVKAAMFKLLGQSQGMDPAAAGAPAPAAASPAAAGAPMASPSPSPAMPAMKAEGDPDGLGSDGKVAAPAGKKMASVGKAEGDPDGLASDGKVKAPAPKKAAAPSPKSGKEANGEVGKSELDIKSLAKSEVTTLLRDVDFSKLEKKDRQAINGFYDGQIGVEKIAHLLGTDIETRLGLNKTAVEEGSEVATLKAQNEELNKKIDGLAKAVTLLMGAPLRKAITGISHLPKPDGAVQGQAQETKPLSKAEVTSKLKELDYSKLNSKDRQAIYGFYDGRVGVDKISHLLNN